MNTINFLSWILLSLFVLQINSAQLPVGSIIFIESGSTCDSTFFDELTYTKGRIFLGTTNASLVGLVNSGISSLSALGDPTHTHSDGTGLCNSNSIGEISTTGRCTQDACVSTCSYNMQPQNANAICTSGGGTTSTSTSGYAFVQLLACRVKTGTNLHVPTNAVVFMDPGNAPTPSPTKVTSCASNWVGYTSAEGRTILPKAIGDASVTRTNSVNSIIPPADFLSHTHNVNSGATIEFGSTSLKANTACSPASSHASASNPPFSGTFSPSPSLNIPYITSFVCQSQTAVGANPEAPAGSLVYFAQSSCPTGYTIANSAYNGRLVVSLPPSPSTNGATWGGTPLSLGGEPTGHSHTSVSSSQARILAATAHPVSSPTTFIYGDRTAAGGSSGTNIVMFDTTQPPSQGHILSPTFKSFGINYPATATTTSASSGIPYHSMILCKKDIPTNSPTTSPSKSIPTSSPKTSSPTKSPTKLPTSSPTVPGATLQPTLSPTSSVPTGSPLISAPSTSPVLASQLSSRPSRTPTFPPTTVGTGGTIDVIGIAAGVSVASLFLLAGGLFARNRMKKKQFFYRIGTFNFGTKGVPAGSIGVATHVFNGISNQEISITTGDILELVEDHGEWIVVKRLPDGAVGAVPKNHVDFSALANDRFSLANPGFKQEANNSLRSPSSALQDQLAPSIEDAPIDDGLPAEKSLSAEALMKRKEELKIFYEFHDPTKTDVDFTVDTLFSRYSLKAINRAVLSKYGLVPSGWNYT